MSGQCYLSCHVKQSDRVRMVLNLQRQEKAQGCRGDTLSRGAKEARCAGEGVKYVCRDRGAHHEGAQVKTINVVRWQVDDTNYVDIEGGQVPKRGERVSLHNGKTSPSGWFEVYSVQWYVDDESERGYRRSIATVYLQGPFGLREVPK